MRVNEIFHSLSGEGIHAGIPTVFVRLAGCNLDCTYCDTQYARNNGEEMTVYEIKSRVFELAPTAPVLITGGEPLFHPNSEVYSLLSWFKSMEIETNGSIPPPDWFTLVDCWSVDVKCPSSGPSYGSFKPKWLRRLRKQDQLKFVVGTQEDLNFVRGFLNGLRIKPTILISPVTGMLTDKKVKVEEYWNREWLQEVAELCKEQNVRMSLQLHKLIWGDKKGV